MTWLISSKKVPVLPADSVTALTEAVASYSKINAQGIRVDRRETVDLNALFNRMTEE